MKKKFFISFHTGETLAVEAHKSRSFWEAGFVSPKRLNYFSGAGHTVEEAVHSLVDGAMMMGELQRPPRRKGSNKRRRPRARRTSRSR